MEKMRFLFQGESGLVLEFGDEIDPAVNTRVHALSRSIVKEHAGLIEVRFQPRVKDILHLRMIR